MHIVQVFNNNVVLARTADGGDVVLTGRGIGFSTAPGRPVDPARVSRMFVPAGGMDHDHLGRLLTGVAPEYLHLVGEALASAGLGQRVADSVTLLVAVADHVAFAVRRADLGIDVDYPLLAEVKHLYAEDYAQAQLLLRAINERLATPLPDRESVALALHLVNAGFTTGDLSFTYTMTGVIQQMVAVIESSYGKHLDDDSVSLSRFITHVRFLFVRIHAHRQLDQQHSVVGKAIRESYPEALDCALRLAALVEMRLGAALTEDEISYLALHVARVAADEG